MNKAREIYIFRHILDLFLHTEKRTTLQNVTGVSASTASRFLNRDAVDDKGLWKTMTDWGKEQIAKVRKRGRHGDIILRLDLTCIEKTGKKIPFARVFNGKYGIQVVMLHASIKGFDIPLGYRIYRGKGTSSVVTLALALLQEFPASYFPGRVTLMADTGFNSCTFCNHAKQLGFEPVILGIACNIRLGDKRRVDKVKKRGEQVTLHKLPDVPLWLSWCDVPRNGEKKRFYVVSTFACTGTYIAKRYKKRWMIESFFKIAKHDFALKEARLRTKRGIRWWIFLSCLALTLASFQRLLAKVSQKPCSYLEAAKCVRNILLDVLEWKILLNIEQLNSITGCRHRLSYS